MPVQEADACFGAESWLDKESFSAAADILRSNPLKITLWMG